MWNYLYLGVCLFFSILIIIIFYSKPRLKTKENKYFKFLIYSNIFSVACEMLLQIYTLNFGVDNTFTVVLSRIYLISILLWFTNFSKYIFYLFKPVADEENYDAKLEKFNKYFRICNISHDVFFAISFVLFLILKLEYHINGTEMYSFGMAVSFLRFSLGTFMASWIIVSCHNHKKILNAKHSPIFVAVFLLLINIFLQKINPSLLIVSFTLTFLDYILFFTIENPDVKMIEQLNIARDQADRANNAKSDFLSSMSHEIRTPLNAIVGFSQALSEEDLPFQAKEEVKDIMMASETLLDIVNGILDISKIEANKLEIVNTEYNFNTMLEELVSLSKARIGDKSLDFRYEFSPDIPKYMFGDKVRVKQIILNLLTNAIKYTQEGWIEFRVNCVRKDDICRLIVSVQDTGMGIKKESIDKLFTRFERLDVEKNNTIEGTGLGLAITKKLLELMHGQIVVQSIYGEGSKFTVAIDQKIVENPTNPNLERTQMMDLSAIRNIDLTNRRILIVDDNKINLKVASRLLQDYHCIIDTLDSGIECVDKINLGASYDLILMDDMMPKQSGVETLHKLQENPSFKTPVIALTANAISGMKEKYLAEGFNDYLSKPIDKTELNRVLNKYLG